MTTTTKRTRPVKQAAAPNKTATAMIQVRIDSKTKDRAARFFKRHGLSTSDGVRLLIDRALKDKDPWLAHEMSSHIPNAETHKAIEEGLAEKSEPVTLEELRKMWDEE